MIEPFKPYRDHRNDPPFTFYWIAYEAGKAPIIMDKFSCNWCKRTILDIKGRIDMAVNAPVDLLDFGLAVNIICKTCKQQYRLVVSDSFKG